MEGTRTTGVPVLFRSDPIHSRWDSHLSNWSVLMEAGDLNRKRRQVKLLEPLLAVRLPPMS
jgi:hypothetical protein